MYYARACESKEETVNSQLELSSKIKPRISEREKKTKLANYSGNVIVTLPKALCKLGEKFTCHSVIEYFSLHRLQVAYFIQFYFHISHQWCAHTHILQFNSCHVSCLMSINDFHSEQ